MLFLRQRAVMHAPQSNLKTRIHIKYKYKLRYRYKYKYKLKYRYIIFTKCCLFRELRCLRHKIHMGLFLTFLLADLSWIFTALIQVKDVKCFKRSFCDSIMNNIYNALNYEKL